MDLTDRFAALWQGRKGAYGEVWGECVERTLTKADWEAHLYQGNSIGIYPLVPCREIEGASHLDGFMVHWGATDIDLGFDMLVLARNIQTALAALDIDAFVERSKGKGYHVIAHASDWIPAADMRNTFLVAHQLAGVRATEVYPKQVTLEGKRWGNYLNLPYAHMWAIERKRVVLFGDEVPMDLETYVRLAEESLMLNSPSKFWLAAGLYQPPVSHAPIVLSGEPTAEASVLARKLKGLGYTIWKDATPLEGGDRSTMLARLAHLCHDDELSAEEAYVIVDDVDQRCGKFVGRKDRDDQLLKLVERAYS